MIEFSLLTPAGAFLNQALFERDSKVSLNCLQRDKMGYRRCSFLPDVFLQRVYTQQ